MSNSSERIATEAREAVVVGGASGIGWATAQALAAEGCRITVADLNADGARSRAAELGDQHVGAYVDVTDEDSVQRLFDDLVFRRAAAAENRQLPRHRVQHAAHVGMVEPQTTD